VTYVNNIPDQDVMGYTPVPYRGLPDSAVAHFGQSMHIPGFLRDPVLPNYGLNNTQNLAALNNGIPTFPDVNIYSPISTTYNVDIGGDSGGGGGGTDRASVTVTGNILQMSTGTNATGGIEYALTTNPTGAFCTEVASCVAGLGLVGFGGVSSNAGSISADSTNDSMSLLGDWSGSSPAGSTYIKTTASSSSDVINFSFEKFLYTSIGGDVGTAISAGAKDATLTFEGGPGVTTEVAADGTNGKVTISNQNAPLMVLVTSIIGNENVDNGGSGNPTQLGANKYGVKLITFSTVSSGGTDTRSFSLSSETYTMFDFTSAQPNEPSLGSNNPATLDYQLLEVQTGSSTVGSICMAYQITGGAAWNTVGVGPMLVRSGLGKFGATC